MQRRRLFFALLTVAMAFAACSGSSQRQTVAERKAQENQTRNPVKKGRYQCYRFLTGNFQTTDDLFILSNKMYQVKEITGTYSFDKGTSALTVLDGPLQGDSLIGFYTAKGAPVAGGHLVWSSMIQFQKQGGVDSGGKRVAMHCHCAEEE